MSVKLMSAIFETEFRDLKDAEGNVTKASTAKLVLLALADHANDEGEGAYPGLTKMEKKTALSRQGILNTYDALKYNGVIYLVGESKLGTNNYTINTASFPSTRGGQPALLVNPLDQTGQPTLPEVVNPLDLNHPLTIKEPYKTDELQGEYKSTAYRRGEQETPDKLEEMLKMANFPGAKKATKIDAVLSYLGGALRRNTETKEWRGFAEYIVSDGREVAQFVKWLLSQPDYKPQFYPVKKMQELYPQAFIEETPVQTPNEGRGFYG